MPTVKETLTFDQAGATAKTLRLPRRALQWYKIGGLLTRAGGTAAGYVRQAFVDMWIGEEGDKANAWKTDADKNVDMWQPGISTGLVLDSSVGVVSGQRWFYKFNQKVALQRYTNPILYAKVQPNVVWTDLTSVSLTIEFEYELQTPGILKSRKAYSDFIATREEYTTSTKHNLLMGRRTVISVFLFPGTANVLNKVQVIRSSDGKIYIDQDTLEKVYTLHAKYARYKSETPVVSPSVYLVDSVAIPPYPTRQAVIEASATTTLVAYTVAAQGVVG
jgi:hypothetical protein